VAAATVVGAIGTDVAVGTAGAAVGAAGAAVGASAGGVAAPPPQAAIIVAAAEAADRRMNSRRFRAIRRDIDSLLIEWHWTSCQDTTAW
jgi:hypothetical protein